MGAVAWLMEVPRCAVTSRVLLKGVITSYSIHYTKLYEIVVAIIGIIAAIAIPNLLNAIQRGKQRNNFV